MSNDIGSAVGSTLVNIDTISIDIAEIVDRFVNYRSFSEHSHGGGRESNVQYLIVLLLLTYYLKKASNHVMASPESLAHCICNHLITATLNSWNECRFTLLKEIADTKKNWAEAKQFFLMWAFVDYFQNNLLSVSV